MKKIAALLVLLTTMVVSSISYASIVVDWGYNRYGEMNAPAGLTDAISVAGGTYFSAALKSNGTVVVWGSTSYGVGTPPSGLAGVTAIAAGSGHILALKSDHTVVGWGSSGYGQATPPSGLNDVIAIAAGSSHSLALKSDGTVVGWGRNYEGQISIPAGLTDAIAIAAGNNHSLALKSNGTVVGWGENRYGETIPPAGLSGVIAIAAGYCHSLALKSDGTVVVWGDRVPPPAGLTGVTAIATGGHHSLALKSDGTVVGWGSNSANPPERLSGVSSIASGWDHSLAVADMQNSPPTADAGPDRYVEATGSLTTILLDAGNSSDPDGDTLMYSWRTDFGQDLGYEVLARPMRSPGTFTFILSVEDPFGGTSSDSVTVTVRDTTPPAISSIKCAPSLYAAGDKVQIQATVTDATKVAYVKADGRSLSLSCANTWTGTITASAELGTHNFTVTASDGKNPPGSAVGTYTTTGIMGINIRDLDCALVAQASEKWLFRVWGRVNDVSYDTLTITSNIGQQITVTVPGLSGIGPGAFVSVRGILYLNTYTPSMVSDPSWITQY